MNEHAIMALGEPPEEYVIRSNLTSVTRAVEQNLSVIPGRLVEQAFITAHAASNITGTLGKPPSSMANDFMRSVQSKMTRSYETREQWFEKFVTILANDTTEGELVKKLIRDLVGKKPYKGQLLKYIQDPAQQGRASQQVSTVAEKISRHSEPDLLTLMDFPAGSTTIDIAVEIGASYSKFGIFLLKDGKRNIISALEKAHNQDPEVINQEIFTKWLSGVNGVAVTWDWLVKCLYKAGLHSLRETVENGLTD